MARRYPNTSKDVGDLRISAATSGNDAGVLDGDSIRRGLVYGAIPTPTAAQRADALAYLQRHDAGDIAKMLGLVAP